MIRVTPSEKISLAIIVCISVVDVSGANYIHWTSYRGDGDYKSLSSAGGNGKVKMYICRSRAKEDIIAGMLWFSGELPICYTAYMGKSHRNTTFEVLRYSSETTSWIPYHGNTGINNIVAGQIHRSVTFVCRAFYNNWLTPGYLSLRANACHVGIGPGVTYHEIKEDFEVLAINKYALLTGNPACISY